MQEQMTGIGRYVLYLHVFLPCLAVNQDAFSFVSLLHQNMCTASGGRDHHYKPTCCGFCSNDVECDRHGTCCLTKYRNFSEGKNSLESTRYKCVLPKYLTSKRETLYVTAETVEPVWMISKCDPNFRYFLEHDTIKHLCENPDSSGSVESLLPVTSGSEYFRNKFCAYCNGANALYTSSWRMEIQCADATTVMYTNILSTVREKKCNMFFRPPVLTDTCSIPKYKINKCNETGLWQIYNDTIKQACESFVDPFNSTYQNYFCYLCNSHEIIPRDNWDCPAPFEIIQGTVPVYTVELDFSTLTRIGLQDLDCDVRTQFLDYKKKVCRDILCQQGRYLLNWNTCKLNANFEPLKPCISTFLKLTPVQGTTIPGNLLTDASYIDDIWRFLFFYMDATFVRVEIFANPKWYKAASFVDYFVMKLVFLKQDMLSLETPDANEDVLSKLIRNIHQKVLTSYASKQKFYCEIGEYKYISEESIQIQLNIPSATMSLFDELILFQNKQIQHKRVCRDTGISVLQKINICPFITLNLNELFMRKKFNFLDPDNKDINYTSSTFDYRIQGGNISLCLEDFIILYDILYGPNYGSVKGYKISCNSWRIIYVLLLSIFQTLL